MKLSVVTVAALGLSAAGCKLILGDTGPSTAQKTQPTRAPRPVSLQTFTDSQPGVAVADAGGAVWMGTGKGLWRFDLAHDDSGLYVGVKEGLPSAQVTALSVDPAGSLWVATSVGLAHQVKGAWKPLAPPATGFTITTMITTTDGALWVGGPEGLARQNPKRGGAFEKLLGDTPIAALASAGSDVWVGTANHFVAHIVGDRVEAYGPAQGCEVEKVRSLVATPNGVMVLGEGGGHARIAFFDGERFYSYRLKAEAGVSFDWLRRIGDEVLLGSYGSQQIYSLARAGDSTEKGSPTDTDETLAAGSSAKLSPVRATNDVWPPFEAGAQSELPVLTAPRPGDKPPAPAPAPAASSSKGKKGAASGKKGAAAVPAPAPAPAPASSATPAGGATPPPSSAPQAPSVPSPVFSLTAWSAKLPVGANSVGPDGPQLIVGTRFTGAAIVGKDAPRYFRRSDLGTDARRLSVACTTETDCWVTTGAPRAYHWDGKTFEVGDIDGEAGSKVLAVLTPPNGALVAVHRGATDSSVRFSTIMGDGRWNQMLYHDLSVPAGVADVTFAAYGPNKNLWLGLRYIDKDGDGNDWGAVEINFDKGRTIFHRQLGVMAATDPSVGTQLPNDLQAVYFRGEDIWFGTRSSVVRLKGTTVTTFGEAEGVERELVHDILEGADGNGNLWAATMNGVVSFDGKKWNAAPDTSPLKLRATALARDPFGGVYVATRGGVALFTPGNPDKNEPMGQQKYDTLRGLADNNVFDAKADRYGRIWVLTEKGISLLQR